MKDFSYITSSSPAFVENMYRDFVKDPGSVDPELRKFFEGFDFAINQVTVSGNGKPATMTTAPEEKKAVSAEISTDDAWMHELRVYRLILGYRNKGHLIAHTNPIRPRKDRGANIELNFFGLTEEDMDKEFRVGNLIGLGTARLKDILQYLEKCYASHIGAEFKYISDQKKIDWL